MGKYLQTIVDEVVDADASRIVKIFGGIWAAYLVALVVYRLYFSPLSSFPGPKLAACTKCYELYYDVILRGQYSFQIQRLHKKYGISQAPSTLTASSACLINHEENEQAQLLESIHLSCMWTIPATGKSSILSAITKDTNGLLADSAPTPTHPQH